MLDVAPHPRLDLGWFVAELPAPLAELPSPAWLRELLVPGAGVDDAVRSAVRDVLRGAGYKPTGRGKPASEYLVRAATDGALASINLAVDAGNAVSLASGLPVSVVDLGKLRAPLRVDVAPPGSRFVFNTAGQEIDVAGLPCLLDAGGPCANAVKDAQRSKTDGATRRTLCLVWGSVELGKRTARTVEQYRELLARAGVTTSTKGG
jgi:DNA/RNA-binding domain of Phe-tRNA-synthetase-like protein